MAEIYLMVSLTEGDGETISLVEVLARHDPDLPRDRKVKYAEEILVSLAKRVIQRYDGQTWEVAKQRAKEVAKGV